MSQTAGAKEPGARFIFCGKFNDMFVTELAARFELNLGHVPIQRQHDMR